MEWGDKTLNTNEITLLFAVMNEQHDEIVNGVKKIIKEFQSQDYYVDEDSDDSELKEKRRQRAKKAKSKYNI